MSGDAAVVVAGVGRVELQPCAPPASAPGPGEVGGRTLFTVVSPGTEMAVYTGVAQWAALPFNPGYAAVFEAEAVGEGVDDVAPGDLLLCMGPHRSWQRCRREDAEKVPAGLAPEAAVFARLVSVSMTALATASARPPDAVAVLGLGVVGNLAAQMFCACGYRVVACDPVRSRRAAARACGLADVHAALPAPAGGGGGVAMAVECSGHEQAVLAACRAVRKGGEVVLVGVPWQRRSDACAFELLSEVFHSYVRLRSGWEWEVPMRAADFRQGSVWGHIAGAMRWMVEGRIRVGGLAATHPPAAAPDVFAAIHGRTLDALTAVFDWR